MPLPAKAPRVTPLDASLSDAELVCRAREGDGWAEGAIYRRHGPPLANLAARLLGNREEALDVLQDVFVEALGALHTLRDAQALEPWLRRRTVHQVHRQFRRRRWGRWLGRAEAVEDVPLNVLARPGVSPEVRLELARVSKVLQHLPARQRIAWVLHRVEGETLPEVAEACGVSLATVKRDVAAAQSAVDAAKEDTR